MSASFHTDIVTPENSFASLEATLVEVPGEQGNFGVLAGHAPTIATIRPGVIDVYAVEGGVQRFFIAGGMAEVTPERCTILAEHAENMDSLTLSIAQQRLADAQKAEDAASFDAEKTQAAREKAMAEALVAAFSDVDS